MLITTVKSGMLLVHLRRAKERIWHERLEAQWMGGDTPAQQVLFPVSIELPEVRCSVRIRRSPVWWST